LALIFRGALAIGIDRNAALALALRCARDSIPPIRLLVLRDLAANDAEKCRVIDVANRLHKPWTTIRRTLEALYVLELVIEVEVETGEEEEDEKSGATKRKKTKIDKSDPKNKHYDLAADVDLSACEENLEEVPN
jgi:hypothetical protein